MTRSLQGQHILKASQFNTTDIQQIFNTADALTQARAQPFLAQTLVGKTLACVFYEPSTRTSSSFIAAMCKLGGHVIPITQGVQFSSVAKGETLEDTIVTLGQYADAIVLRHPETGAAERAASVSPVPVINAGDGVGEHPTQALLDLYTIRREKGRVGGLQVVLCGDLAHGRTIHSLVHLLSLYPGNHLHFVSPPHLRAPRPLLWALEGLGVAFSEGESLEAVLPHADVLYMTRVQKERWGWSGMPIDLDARAPYILGPDQLGMLKPDAAILHPLPRVEEIPPDVDKDPRAAYFRQVQNGLFVRAALLKLILGAS